MSMEDLVSGGLFISVQAFRAAKVKDAGKAREIVKMLKPCRKWTLNSKGFSMVSRAIERAQKVANGENVPQQSVSSDMVEAYQHYAHHGKNIDATAECLMSGNGCECMEDDE
jgi:hypothetical protein